MNPENLKAARAVIDALLEQGERNPPTARGQRARAKIRVAAIELLNEKGYRRVSINDVARRADMAAGLFYHYYLDLRTLCLSLILEFLDALDNTEVTEAGVPRGDWFGRILAHYQNEVACFSRNPGVVQCISVLAEELPEVGLLWRESRHLRSELLVARIGSLFPAPGISDSHKRMLVHMLGSVGVSTLDEYYLQRSSPLLELGLDDEAMAEWLAALFYRALFLRNPPVEQLRHARVLEQIFRE